MSPGVVARDAAQGSAGVAIPSAAGVAVQCERFGAHGDAAGEEELAAGIHLRCASCRAEGVRVGGDHGGGVGDLGEARVGVVAGDPPDIVAGAGTDD